MDECENKCQCSLVNDLYQILKDQDVTTSELASAFGTLIGQTIANNQCSEMGEIAAVLNEFSKSLMVIATQQFEESL